MDAFAEIGVFTRVVDARSFSRAGTLLGLTPSGVSRAVSRLEDRLGVRLLNRSTRSLSLTDAGAAYYARCARILSEHPGMTTFQLKNALYLAAANVRLVDSDPGR